MLQTELSQIPVSPQRSSKRVTHQSLQIIGVVVDAQEGSKCAAPYAGLCRELFPKNMCVYSSKSSTLVILLDVEGDGRHFHATIVSAMFRDKGKVQRHQLVYQVLGDLMVEDVHALTLKTVTPEEWSQG